MSASMLSRTMSLIDFPAAVARPRPAPSAWRRLRERLAVWIRARLAIHQRDLLPPHLASTQIGGLLVLDGQASTPNGRMARLRAAPDASVGTVVSVAALAGVCDVAAMLAQMRRVLRPGGRLLFVEPVAAAVGTRLRRLQKALGGLGRFFAGALDAPRDLWNDLSGARFDRLRFQRRDLRGLLGWPVPHLVGEAQLHLSAHTADGPSRSADIVGCARRADPAALPALPWDGPAVGFFG